MCLCDTKVGLSRVKSRAICIPRLDSETNSAECSGWNNVLRTSSYGYNMQRGVEIIECLDKDDPGSEGRCLKHIFNLMEIKSNYSHVDVGSIEDLLCAIAKSKFQYIHISAHGPTSTEDRFRG